MTMTRALFLEAYVRDLNIGAGGEYLPPGHVERHATFTVSVVGQCDEADLVAVLVGRQGRTLMVRDVIQDDLRLPSDQAQALAQAIYEGHFGIEDHDRPARQCHLSGEMNVEPYWDAVMLGKFTPAI